MLKGDNVLGFTTTFPLSYIKIREKVLLKAKIIRVIIKHTYQIFY